MFNLSIREKPATPSIWKMQQLELENSDLGETNFVVKIMTRATSQRVKILRTSQVYFFKKFRGESSQYKEPGKNSNIENATSTSGEICFS
jgi:hypothetical protein